VLGQVCEPVKYLGIVCRRVRSKKTHCFTGSFISEGLRYICQTIDEASAMKFSVMISCNDDLAEDMDDNTNDGRTMKICRGSEIDIPILLTLGLSRSSEFSDLSHNRVWFETYMGRAWVIVVQMG
jgi:hypothetical protein